LHEQNLKIIEGHVKKSINLKSFESLGVEVKEFPSMYLSPLDKVKKIIESTEYKTVQVPDTFTCNELHYHELKKNENG
jgi:hypothetical protein